MENELACVPSLEVFTLAISSVTCNAAGYTTPNAAPQLRPICVHERGANLSSRTSMVFTRCNSLGVSEPSFLSRRAKEMGWICCK